MSGTRRPVRVCFLIDSLSRAGTESQLLALIRELDRNEVEPTLVLLDGTSAESRSLEPENCPVLRLGVTRLVGRMAIRGARTLARFWHEQRPDVLQVYFLDSAYFGVPLAKLCGVPKIVRVRNNLGYFLTRKHRILNRIVGRLANVALTNTDAGKDALVAAERLPADRVVVLANGVDTDRFAGFPPPLSRAEIRIGCVANLRPVKNVDGLLRAAATVCEQFPTATFEIAGDGPERANLESLRDALGLRDRVRFHGSVGDVPGFLRTLDVAVLPSHSEGMSNAVLEYMAAGRAVVATAVGANPKLVDDGVCGLVVPPGDAPALAAAIVRLLREPALARRFGEAARNRVESEYGRPAMCRRFEAFYRGLVSVNRE